MNQEHERRWLYRITLLALVGVLISLILVTWYYQWEWTGFGELTTNENTQHYKTLWDWLDLLIVPLGLFAVATFFNQELGKREIVRNENAKQRDTAQEQDRFRENALQTYFDIMTHLILEKNLLQSSRQDEVKVGVRQENVENKSESNKEQNHEETNADTEYASVRLIAQVRTVNTLRRLSLEDTLDVKRVKQVFDFLHDAGLYEGEMAILQLAAMDRINLRGFYLMRANLSGAHLWAANLSRANLAHANLSEVRVWQANLSGADLHDANLSGAHLNEVDLSEADLRDADLSGAYLAQANLSGAHLRDTKFDTKTILPDAKNVGSYYKPEYDKYWSPNTDMSRYTDPKHPDYWQPDWVT